MSPNVPSLMRARGSDREYGLHSLWRRQLGTPKTEASARTLHLPDVLVDLLAEYRKASRFNGPDDFVFARVDGSPQDPDYLRKEVLDEALRSAGITPGYRTHGFHMFRHSAGDIVHKITRDVKTAQSLLGHSLLSTTANTYTRVDKAVGAEASEALAKAIFSEEDLVLVSEEIQ
jgi:integrase